MATENCCRVWFSNQKEICVHELFFELVEAINQFNLNWTEALFILEKREHATRSKECVLTQDNMVKYFRDLIVVLILIWAISTVNRYITDTYVYTCQNAQNKVSCDPPFTTSLL